MIQSKAWKIPLECLFYLAAAVCFFALRTPLLPYWWTDFNSDFALVGVMAQHTLEGRFPIYYYGQNYMGGLEWLTAALGAKLLGAGTVSMEILRWNDLLWWFAASGAWVLFLRRISFVLAIAMAGFFAFGNYVLLWVSVLQELSAQYVFFGALISWFLWEKRTLLGARGFWFGALLGFAWWTNQSVVFFLLPAIWVFHAEPGAWIHRPLAREFLRPAPGIRWLYAVLGFLFLVGVAVALAGGLNVPVGRGHLKIPNGLSLAKTAVIVLAVIQLLAKLRDKAKPVFRSELWRLLLLARPFLAGFALGFAPAWLGRILRLYEKSYGVGLAILPIKDWGDQAHAFATSMDTLLFSSLLTRSLGAFAPWVMGAFLLALAGVAWWQRREALVRFALGVLALNCVYVFFSSRAHGAPPRYLYPAMIGAWLIVLVPATSYGLRGARFAITGALLALAALGGWKASGHLMDYYAAQEWRRENIRSVLHELEARNFQRCWGDYWTGYLLVYLSGERVIFTSHRDAPDNQVRVRDYDRLVKEAAPACYVSRNTNSPLGELQFSEANPWVKK